MLRELVDYCVYSIAGFSPGSSLGNIVSFFLYDSVKILLLLFIMITAVGFLRTFLPQQKVKKWLSGRKGLGNVSASLFGSVTPFCSCSSIPIFLGFLEAGIPLGIAFSFLITSPLVNEYLVVLMLGFFGWKITVLYVLSGITIGVVAGYVLGRMGLEKYVVKDLISYGDSEESEQLYKNLRQRIDFGFSESVSIVKKVWLLVLLGVGVGALIHNYVPSEWIQSAIARTGFWSVPIATILGVPMYGSCAAIVPIAVVLFQKGIPLGTALSFMMATAALSLPEAIVLRRAMKLKLIGIFFGITTLAIIFTGFLFNIFQRILVP
ncbi:MAG: permease [bacterium]